MKKFRGNCAFYISLAQILELFKISLLDISKKYDCPPKACDEVKYKLKIRKICNLRNFNCRQSKIAPSPSRSRKVQRINSRINTPLESGEGRKRAISHKSYDIRADDDATWPTAVGWSVKDAIAREHVARRMSRVSWHGTKIATSLGSLPRSHTRVSTRTHVQPSPRCTNGL